MGKAALNTNKESTSRALESRRAVPAWTIHQSWENPHLAVPLSIGRRLTPQIGDSAACAPRSNKCSVCRVITTLSALMPRLAAMDGELLPRTIGGDNAEPRGWLSISPRLRAPKLDRRRFIWGRCWQSSDRAGRGGLRRKGGRDSLVIRLSDVSGRRIGVRLSEKFKVAYICG
jgi:hypothetical protein